MAKKFNIIKKKNLPDEAKIVGFTFLKEPKENEVQSSRKRFDFIELSNKNKIGCMSPKRKSWAYTKGYVGIDNKTNVFVEVKSRLLIIILVILFMCGMLFAAYKNLNPNVIDKFQGVGNFDIFDDQQTTEPSKENNQSEPTITFAGYGKYIVSAEKPSVELHNPKGNFVDMVFTLTDETTGELIARTNKVSAGKYVYVDVMDFYKTPGVYTILINVSTFDAKTGTQMNGINQKMEVTVK